MFRSNVEFFKKGKISRNDVIKLTKFFFLSFWRIWEWERLKNEVTEFLEIYSFHLTWFVVTIQKELWTDSVMLSIGHLTKWKQVKHFQRIHRSSIFRNCIECNELNIYWDMKRWRLYVLITSITKKTNGNQWKAKQWVGEIP